ncbi:enoyl-CoA hydratase family protein [uncultured Corynebacterium sp.]|uniref:enoyl-CoA hydratase family protein n=1 Tax=uncultured Corynebacterium sp. TaxID=159447 RepID=UPI0025D65D80|nr:enoyl-CoA hydratase family protein [uncultured Corynebacterium sp.]
MPVTYESRAGAARIVLDEPARRNALSPALLDDLAAALARAAVDVTVRSVVLSHTGPTFCAGADLSAAEGSDMAEAAGRFISVLRAVVACPKPVIAAVDGSVRAGGVGLAAACDIVVASRGSSFGTTETRIGVAPAMIALTVLPRMDARAASRHLLLGDVYSAADALRYGLVTEVTEGTVDPTTRAEELADQLLRCSPQGLRETKALLTADILARFDHDGAELSRLSASLFSSPEAKEGMHAFLEKRAPAWMP